MKREFTHQQQPQTTKSSLYVPSAPPTPPDLLDLQSACISGTLSHSMGFRVSANSYLKKKGPEEKLKAWAWELGWREQASLMAGKSA